MGIQVEYNPDLALRSYDEYKSGRRQESECLPEVLQVGTEYSFLKKGQRLYWLHGELPLLQTAGNEQLGKPLASIRILEVTHRLVNGEVWTQGRYRVEAVFHDEKIHFNGFAKV